MEEEISKYLKKLFPINRSITGHGNRETLKILSELIPLKIKEYPSGKKVFDWIIPDEWNIKDAWIKNSEGVKIVDYSKCNLHVLSYSMAVNQTMNYDELVNHLYYLENQPDAIPYRTTYYKKKWGFCLSYNDFKKYIKKDELYKVFINSSFNSNGSMTIGELVIKGKLKQEHLISTYFCHPSLANDNLSGVILTAFLSRELLKKNLNYSYRIIFIPETIGAIAYCAMNRSAMKKIDCGLVITTVGGKGKYAYKQSFRSDHYINKMIEKVFEDNKTDFITYPFDIHGSDERQYSSQGFKINVATICKDKYYEYPFYHTSFDNLNFVSAENIYKTLNLYIDLIEKMDKNLIYKNIKPNCEVMLSKYNLYPEIGGGILPTTECLSELDIILWLLYYCDGKKSLSEIADRLKINISSLYLVIKKIENKKIVKLMQ